MRILTSRLPKTRGGWFALTMALVIPLLAVLLAACGGGGTGVIPDGQVGYELNLNFKADSPATELPYAVTKHAGETIGVNERVGDVVNIPPGKVVVRENPKWSGGADTEPYVVVARAGAQLVKSQGAADLSVGGTPYGVMDDILVVPENQYAVVRGGKLLAPGTYPDVPKSYTIFKDAAIVAPTEIGVAIQNGRPKLIPPGVYQFPKEELRTFPLKSLIFYSLTEAKVGDLQANCYSVGYYACDKNLQGMILSDPSIKAEVEVVVVAQVNMDDPKLAEKLWGYDSAHDAMTQYVIVPLRGARAESASLSPESINTADGRATLAGNLLKLVSTAGADRSPFKILDLRIRQVYVGGPEYQQALDEAAKREAEAKSKLAQIAQDKLLQQAQQELDNERLKNSRDQLLLDAEAQAKYNQQVLGSIPPGMSACLYLAATGKQLPPACTELPYAQQQQAAPAPTK